MVHNPVMQAPSKYEEARKRGNEKLEYWVACERARRDPNSDHAGMYAEAVPSNLAQRLAEMSSGASAQRAAIPTDVTAPARRYLEVEGAFIAMAARSAREAFGDFDDLDQEGRAEWQRLVSRGSRSIRALCFHVLVLRLPMGQYSDKEAFLSMARYGMTFHGYSRWLKHRIDDVREFLGTH